MSDLAVHGFFMLFAISFLMGLATVFTWVERKQSAITSDRIGANRCYVRIPFTNIKFIAWGLFHGVADGGKLLLKENFTPRTYDRFCYNLAPWLAGVPVLLVFAVIPFGGALIVGERSYVMQIAPLDAGVLFVLAISGIGVLSTMLAGWSSNNKFSLMGAARAASQMISYEVAMGLALISMVVTYGTLDLNAMVQWQSQSVGRTSCPPGASSFSRWRSSCSSPRASPRTSASPSTCPSASPSWWPATSPNTPR